MKVLSGLSLLFLLISCENRDYFLVYEEKLDTDEIAQIDFYRCAEGIRWQDTKPMASERTTKSIHKIISSINYSNSPTIGKGACWDKICLVKWDTTIVLMTNGEIVGNSNNGHFFYFQEPAFIQKYFE